MASGTPYEEDAVELDIDEVLRGTEGEGPGANVSGGGNTHAAARGEHLLLYSVIVLLAELQHLQQYAH